MLDSWIREILEPLQSTSHLSSEILDDSAPDEKQLIKALKAQVDELRHKREAYSFASPLHRMTSVLLPDSSD